MSCADCAGCCVFGVCCVAVVVCVFDAFDVSDVFCVDPVEEFAFVPKILRLFLTKYGLTNMLVLGLVASIFIICFSHFFF